MKGIGDVWVTNGDGVEIWRNGKLNLPRRPDIKKPDLTPVRKVPSVELGPMNPRLAKSRLAGKTGRGTIGKYKVTMEFCANGDLIISGEMTGEGKWSPSTSTSIKMETAISSFRGNIDGDKVSGLKFLKDNKDNEPAMDWSIVLRKADSLADTVWHAGPSIATYGGELYFGNDGKVSLVDHGDGQVISGDHTYNGTYKVDGSNNHDENRSRQWRLPV